MVTKINQLKSESKNLRKEVSLLRQACPNGKTLIIKTGIFCHLVIFYPYSATTKKINMFLYSILSH